MFATFQTNDFQSTASLSQVVFPVTGMYRKSIEMQPQQKVKDADGDSSNDSLPEVKNKEEFRSESIAALRARALAHTAKLMNGSKPASPRSGDSCAENLDSSPADDVMSCRERSDAANPGV